MEKWREEWLQEMETRKWDEVIERLERRLEESRRVGRVMGDLVDVLGEREREE